METKRGRPPSAGKPGLFNSTGHVITKQQKRSSSKSSIIRRLSESATSLVNGAGAATAAGQPETQPLDRERRASAVPAATTSIRSSDSPKQTDSGSSSSGGKMSFKKHFQRTKSKLFGLGEGGPGAGAIGGSTVNAPMLNGGTASDGDSATTAVSGIPAGPVASGPAEAEESDSDNDTESIIQEDDNGALRNGSAPQAAAESPVTTTGTASVRTGSFPKIDEQAAATGPAGDGDAVHEQEPQQQKLQQPSHTVSFVVPAPPPPVPQKEVATTSNTVSPAVPPKIPEPPPPVHTTGAQPTAMGSTHGAQRTQYQDHAPAPGVSRTSTFEEKERGGTSLLNSLKKLRRTDSKRASKGSMSATPPANSNSNTSATDILAGALTAATAAVAMSPPAQSPTKTAFSSQPSPSRGDGSRAVTIGAVPSILRPGGSMSQPQQTQGQMQQLQQAQQIQQMQRVQQMQLNQRPGGGYETQQSDTDPQPQPQPSQQQVPCANCKTFYEAAWAQSELNLYALDSQLTAAHQQSASQVALLHERDAEIVELGHIIERLRTRIQEQVKQLEQLPAGIPGININSGYTSAGALPDGQIRSRWIGLRWQIRQCVEARLAALPSSAASSAPVSAERAPFLRSLSPDYDKFLHTRTGSVHLVEAAIWAVLAESVFSSARRSSRMCWAARWSKSFTKINDNMLYSRATDPAFHQWRAQTAAFVRSLDATEDDQQAAAAPYVEAVVRQLEAEVGVLLVLGTGGDAGSTAKGADSKNHPGSETNAANAARAARDASPSSALRRQLFDMVAEAISLDADLCQQRAWFYVHYPTSASGQRYGMPFDARDMETISREGDTSARSSGRSSTASTNNNSGASDVVDGISLVVRPALFKAGNSRGEGYDQTQLIEPSIVCRTPARGMLRWTGGRHDRSRSRG